MWRCFAALFLLGVTAPDAARAVTFEGARAWIECDPAAGRLDVRYGWPADAPRLAGGADFVVAFEKLLEVRKDDEGVWIVGAHAADGRCRLRRETLSLHLAPAYVTENMNARCGAAIGGELTISRGDHKLVDALRFEDPDCGKLEAYVERVTVRAGEDQPLIERAGY